MISVTIIIIAMIININCTADKEDGSDTHREKPGAVKGEPEIPRIDFASTMAVRPHETDPGYNQAKRQSIKSTRIKT